MPDKNDGGGTKLYFSADNRERAETLLHLSKNVLQPNDLRRLHSAAPPANEQSFFSFLALSRVPL